MPSAAALIGALIGLAMGVFNQWIILRMIERHVKAVDDASPTEDEKVAFEARTTRFRRLLAIKSIVVFPILGYALGKAID